MFRVIKINNINSWTLINNANNRDYEKEYAERERQAKLEAERKAEEKRLADIAELKAKIVSNHADQSWQDKLTSILKFECQRGFYGELPVDCVAWGSFQEDVLNEGLKSLEPLSFDEVVAEENALCSKDKREGSACSVWGKSLIQRTEVLVADVATVKSMKLGWGEESTAMSKLTNSAPCYQVSHAYSKRGLGFVGSFREPIQ